MVPASLHVQGYQIHPVARVRVLEQVRGQLQQMGIIYIGMLSLVKGYLIRADEQSVGCKQQVLVPTGHGSITWLSRLVNDHEIRGGEQMTVKF